MYTKSPPIHQTAMALACNDLLLLDNPFQWKLTEQYLPRNVSLVAFQGPKKAHLPLLPQTTS